MLLSTFYLNLRLRWKFSVIKLGGLSRRLKIGNQSFTVPIQWKDHFLQDWFFRLLSAELWFLTFQWSKLYNLKFKFWTDSNMDVPMNELVCRCFKNLVSLYLIFFGKFPGSLSTLNAKKEYLVRPRLQKFIRSCMHFNA